MREAEEIFWEHMNKDDRLSGLETVINAINEARKEALLEAAERATTDNGYYDDQYCIVDKQSILNLINELK